MQYGRLMNLTYKRNWRKIGGMRWRRVTRGAKEQGWGSLGRWDGGRWREDDLGGGFRRALAMMAHRNRPVGGCEADGGGETGNAAGR